MVKREPIPITAGSVVFLPHFSTRPYINLLTIYMWFYDSGERKITHTHSDFMQNLLVSSNVLAVNMVSLRWTGKLLL